MLGNALGDTHYEGDFGGDGFFDTSRGKWRPVDSRLVSAVQPLLRRDVLEDLCLRHKDGGRIGTSLLHGLSDIGEHGKTEMCLAGLLRVCAAHNLGS